MSIGLQCNGATESVVRGVGNFVDGEEWRGGVGGGEEWTNEKSEIRKKKLPLITTDEQLQFFGAEHSHPIDRNHFPEPCQERSEYNRY